MGIPNASAATYPIQAAPDARDFDVFAAAHLGYAVASGCVCTPASSGSTLGVAVASGSVYVGSKTAVAVTGATVTPGAASGSNPRIDLVVVDNTGALSITAGTAAAQPELPAIPASRTVLAAVLIPTSATSITSGNLVDKRVLADYQPPYGTSSSTASRGDHTHSGEYASTQHGSTHDGAAADPITALGGYTLNGVIGMTDQTPSASNETIAYFSGKMIGYYPWPVHQTYLDSIEIMDGDPVFGPLKWSAWPGTSALVTAFGPAGAAVGTGTYAVQAATTALPRRGRYSTPATATTRAGFESSDLVWVGSGINGGWVFQCHINLPDASYANTGASTGSRIFCGMTDQAATTVALNADNPAGNRLGFSYCNVNGGLTNTNWWLTEKNATTETRTDTGIALAQNKLYRMTLHCAKTSGYMGWQIDNLTDATTAGNTYTGLSGTTPTSTALMRAMCGIQTVNAVARNIEILRMGAKVAGP